MSYRLSSKKRQQKKNFWLSSFLVAFLCGVGIILFIILGGAFTTLSSGTVTAVDSFGGMIQAIFSDKQQLQEENTRLRQQLERETVDALQQQIVVDRNNQLLSELGRAEELPRVVAGVVKKPPFSPYDIYTVDAGRNQGITIGDIALYSDFVTLGQVTRVTESAAKVDLFSAPGKETFMNLNGTGFLVTGKGGGTLEIESARDFEVVIGDKVLLPSYALYVAAEVVDIIQKPQDSFKRIVLKTPINIQAVELVSIVPYITTTEDEIE